MCHGGYLYTQKEIPGLSSIELFRAAELIDEWWASISNQWALLTSIIELHPRYLEAQHKKWMSSDSSQITGRAKIALAMQLVVRGTRVLRICLRGSCSAGVPAADSRASQTPALSSWATDKSLDVRRIFNFYLWVMLWGMQASDNHVRFFCLSIVAGVTKAYDLSEVTYSFSPLM